MSDQPTAVVDGEIVIRADDGHEIERRELEQENPEFELEIDLIETSVVEDTETVEIDLSIDEVLIKHS